MTAGRGSVRLRRWATFNGHTKASKRSWTRKQRSRWREVPPKRPPFQVGAIAFEGERLPRDA